MRTYLLLLLSLIFTLVVTILFIITLCIFDLNIFKNVENFQNEENNDSNEVIIETKYGKVKGFRQKVFELEFNQFLNIPYAEPPIKEVSKNQSTR